ncbi:hypothetical protein JK358_00935 [Nocardia sp. 2]|uniref:Glycine zipper domain-containing protein n=1 Tax=Nocardia acididurans TaxID=2802282 RepID=A0ABS1LZK9_9NOCA|nr:glycine zipper domain-containing protein [Nocardia acididurans]MBL1072954.1 hypothetical protein [Nocardia acididurans]
MSDDEFTGSITDILKVVNEGKGRNDGPPSVMTGTDEEVVNILVPQLQAQPSGPNLAQDLPYLVGGGPELGPGESATLPGGTQVQNGSAGDLTQTWTVPGQSPVTVDRNPTLVDQVVAAQQPRQEDPPPTGGIEDFVGLLNVGSLTETGGSAVLPSGVVVGRSSSAVEIDGVTYTTVVTDLSIPGMDPTSYTNRIVSGPGAFMGYGTSYKGIYGSDGLLQSVLIYGSPSVKEVRFHPENGMELVPVDPKADPFSLSYMKPGELDLGFMGYGSSSGALAELGMQLADDPAREIPGYMGEYRVNIGRFPLIGTRAGGMAGLVTLPIAILADVQQDGNTLGEAVLREGTGAIVGTAAGALFSSAVAFAATGGAAGATVGPAGVAVGAIGGAVVGAVTAYLTSKAIQSQLDDYKDPPPDWLLPDDPGYLRDYIESMKGREPYVPDLPAPMLRDGGSVEEQQQYREQVEAHAAWADRLRAAEFKLSEIDGYANGGYFSGQGTSVSDSNLAFISDGEFIVNAAATDKFLPLLEMINSGWVPSPEFLYGLLFGDGDSGGGGWNFQAPIGTLAEALGGGLSARTLELPLSEPVVAEPAGTTPDLTSSLANDLGDLFGGDDGMNPATGAALAQGGLQGFLSGAANGGLVKGITGGISGLASAAGGQIGSAIGAALGSAAGPLGTAVGSVLGSTVGSMIGQTASEIVTKPIEYVASTAKELIGGGFGLIDLANGPGADTAKGDIYNFNGLDPKSAAIAVERVNRRRTLAQQRGGGFGR